MSATSTVTKVEAQASSGARSACGTGEARSTRSRRVGVRSVRTPAPTSLGPRQTSDYQEVVEQPGHRLGGRVVIKSQL